MCLGLGFHEEKPLLKLNLKLIHIIGHVRAKVTSVMVQTSES